MPDHPPTDAEVIEALRQYAELGSIPLREQSAQRPTFSSFNLTMTKTRIIPAASGWLDYLVLQLGTGQAASGFGAMVQYFVATGELAPAVSGLQYRFIHNGALMPSQEFALDPLVDPNINHAAAAPFPAQKRRFNLELYNRDRLVLQVNNTGGADARAFAGLFGYYYPNQSMPRESQESGGFKHVDSWHE